MKTMAERRQFRRADLDIPIMIRPNSEEEEGSPGAALEGQVRNVSLAGVFCHLPTPCSLKTSQTVTCSIIIPAEQGRLFPFTRLHGKGWVVRISPVVPGRRAGDASPNEQVLGVAIAFTPDLTALGTLEHQF